MLWAIALRLPKRSSRWTKGRSCTHIHSGPIKGGRSLGAPLLAVLIFEVMLNGMSLFNHVNLKLPLLIDRMLRSLIVTPDMHRIHHSANPNESNSNFGFNLSCWGRLCSSYQTQPYDGHDSMEIGQPNSRSQREIRLDRMLLQPFSRTDSPLPPRLVK